MNVAFKAIAQEAIAQKEQMDKDNYDRNKGKITSRSQVEALNRVAEMEFIN